MKKFGILAGLAFVALLLGMAGTAVRSDEAQASPTAVLSVDSDVCIFFTVSEIADLTAADVNGDTVVGDSLDDAIVACVNVGPGTGLAANIAAVADALGGDVDDPDTWADVAAAGADQITENAAADQLWILAFVTTEAPVTFLAEEGTLVPSDLPRVDLWTCDLDAEDADCQGAGVAGDDVVVALLTGAGAAPAGATADLVVEQQGVEEVLEYTVVGVPDAIDVVALEDTIMEGTGDEDDDEDGLTNCEELDLSDFSDEIADPTVGGLLATVTDEDDVELAGEWVDWESDDTDVATVSQGATLTIAVDDSVVAANFVCGIEPGTAEITGDIGVDDDTVEITVVGAPAEMTVTVSPASITCNGTASSTVSAALVDADGNTVPAGIDVRFDVVALGIADPIVDQTDAEGVASSKITPLSGVSAGVVVAVTVPDFDLESSVRIDCTAPAPTVAPPPPTVAPPPILPPPTGDGGYLD